MDDQNNQVPNILHHLQNWYSIVTTIKKLGLNNMINIIWFLIFVHFIDMSLILTLTLNNLIDQNILMGAHRSCGQYLASGICVTHWVASFVLCGSMAKLWLCFNTWRMLAPSRLLMFLIGKMISSMVIILSVKFKMIPNCLMVLVPRMRSYCGLLSLLYSTTSGSE